MSEPARATVKKLCILSGNRCAIPGCDQPLVDPESLVIIAEVCHIRGVSGPRHDPNLSEQEVHHFDNLLLLCANHHKVVDGDLERYTVERLERIKQEHLETVTVRQQDECARMLLPWNVPGRNRFFTGREEILGGLRGRLIADSAAALSQPVAVSGLGGAGKSQIAIEYAHRYRDEYRAAFWVLADSPSAVTAGFVEIAQLLGLPEQDAEDQTLVVRAVKRWLESSADWLLILDNADDPELVRPFQPAGPKGHVLLTSRARVFDTLGIVTPVTVEELPPEEALEFLLSRTAREETGQAERDAAAELASELGYLPLALEQAGAFIHANQSRFQHYLAGYRKLGLERLEQSAPKTGDYPDSVATIWSMNFAEVEKTSEASADLLRACAFFAPDAIPLELLAEGASQLGPRVSASLADVAGDPVALDQLLEPVTRYSLIRRDLAARALSIHRLVQEVLKDGMQPEPRRLWAERAVRAVDAAFPVPEFTNWPLCGRLLPQARAASTLVEDRQFAFPQAGRLLSVTAGYLYERAQYAEAEPLYQRALAIQEKALGPDHPDVAATLNNLAGLYRAQGKYAQAEPLYQRSLAIKEKALRPDHPDVATTLNNLAMLYRDQGKYGEAEPVLQSAVTIFEKALGPDHPSVAATLENYAVLLRDTEREAKATELQARAKAIRQKHAEENPD